MYSRTSVLERILWTATPLLWLALLVSYFNKTDAGNSFIEYARSEGAEPRYLDKPHDLPVYVFDPATGDWNQCSKEQIERGEEFIALNMLFMQELHGTLSNIHDEVDVTKLNEASRAYDPRNYRQPTLEDVVYVFGDQLPRAGFHRLGDVGSRETFRFQGRIFKTETGSRSDLVRVVTTGKAILGAGGDPTHVTQSLRTKKIQEIVLGDRITGKNPIPEQAELVEPDPKTWRKISFVMEKENGLSLWVDLLRPLDWIETHDVVVGETIALDMPEMGATGEAKVVYLGHCPRIKTGNGTVVTGKFIHQADNRTNVVRIRIQGQEETTRVTANHPYWSEDRREYIEVGKLRDGEMVDTEWGQRRVVSVTPDPDYTGYLYNLETTEHVFRVGSLGTLVHNFCVPAKLTQAQSDAFRKSARSLWHTRTGAPASLSGLDIHHRIPLEWAHKFPKADPNRAANLIGLRPGADHRSLNRAWSDFKQSLNGRDPTASEIMKHALELDEKFGNLFQFLQ